MDCYYHISEPAVAQCKKCGLFLCAYCAFTSSDGICKDCVAFEKKRERQSLIKCWIWTIILFVILWTLFYHVFNDSAELAGTVEERRTLLVTGMFSVIYASIPFGWRRLNRKKLITDKVVFVYLDTLLFWFVLKLIGSIFIGWIFMIKGFFELFEDDSEAVHRKSRNKKIEYIDPFTGKTLK